MAPLLKMKQKVNIYDIAQMTGVSPATVSNVINGRSQKVSETTRQRVLDCLQTTGYRTNLTARNLVTGRSMLVGVCLPLLEAGATQSDLLENNPFYHEFIDGVERVLLEQGYECVVRGLDDKFKYLDWIQNRSLDGLIDLGNFSNTVFEQIVGLNVPTVLVDNYNHRNESFDVVLGDDLQGGYLATRHLLELGHRKIGIVFNNIDTPGVDRQRYKGYEKALDEFGISERILFQTVMDYSNGVKFGHRLAEENLPVTAMFCTADITAVGIAHGLEERGRSVPQDYSVVGFDDIKILQYITPQITTVRQKIFEKGCLSARVLLDKINNPEHTCQKTVLDAELVVRNSTRSLN